MDKSLISDRFLVFCLYIASIIPRVTSLGCFVCSSINGSEPACEDTFNNTGNFYQQHCEAGRSGRSGLFPGTECIKMTAQLDDYRVIVRTCAVDSGGTNSETELGRESHCWMVNEVKFNDVKMKGCSVACNTDGCNTAGVNTAGYISVSLALSFALLVVKSLT